ncbi:MAG: hypothetical protein OHK0011_18420 [Turneriella sp.]
MVAMYIRRFVVAVLLAISLPIFSQPQTPAPQPALAIVALPDYVDATGSKNYAYLGPSLTDAINNSMQERFDFQRADKAAVDREVKRLWRPGKVPLDSDVKQLAILTRSDYVIVGSYTLNPRKTQVTFATRVFVAPDRFIPVPDVTNPVDATLFDATNRVAAEIVKVIEDDARAQQAKLAAAAPAGKPGEKIALAKAAEAPPPPKPAPAKKSEPEEDDEWRQFQNEREYRSSIHAGIGYQGNYFERHTQFYRYPSSMTAIDAGLRQHGFQIYGQLGMPSTPSGNAIPQTYENSGFWLIGLEAENFYLDFNWLKYGINYRSFNQPNPAGFQIRDLLNWSSTVYTDVGFRVFSIGPVALGLSFATYLDIMSAKHPAKTTGDLLLLWNLEGGLYAAYQIPVIRARLRFAADTSYAVFDQTSETYVVSPFGDVELDGKSRAGNWSGMRYQLSLSRSFQGVTLRAQYFTYPNIQAAFQPVDGQNKPVDSLHYFRFAADYRYPL